MTLYTKEEHAFMRDFVPGHTYQEIRDEFQKRFGYLPESKSFPKSYIGNHKLQTGTKGYFPKGHVPANKGKPMSKEQYEKCKDSMFKPGSIPGNTDPVGTEKLLADGYVWVKIDNRPKAKKTVNWKRKHRLVWERYHGKPVPDGYLITFLDGDRMNFDIENLALISKSEHAILNHENLRYANSECTRVGINIAKVIEAAGRRK